MTATPVAAGWTANNDGGGVGLSFTSPAGITGTQKLVVGLGGSSNGDTFGVPGTGTWSEILLPDNVVTTSGGQFRLYQCLNPASSTVYTFTMSATRRTLVWVLLDGADTAGGTMVDVASSLESAAGSTHAPPSVVPGAAGELVMDFMWFRQFNPDVSTGSPPSTGLTWTELLDVRGLDVGGSGQNVQVNVNYATAGAAGVAVSTAPLNSDDPFEPTLVMRVLFKSAGGSPVSLQDTSSGSGTAGTADGLTVGDAGGGGSGAAGSTDGRALGAGSDGYGTAGTTDGRALGGGSDGGQVGGQLDGLLVGDLSGGSATSGSSDTITLGGITVPDGSGGAGTGGSADTITLGGVVVQDTSSGAGSSGSVDGRALGAGSDGAGTAGSSGSVAVGAGSDGAATSGATDGRALGGTSGGAATGASGDTVTGIPVAISDTSGGAGTGGSPDTAASSQVVHDKMVMPIVIKAQECLVVEVGKLASPPKYVQVRPGATFVAMADQFSDECCEGIAWVRPGQQTPTTAHWPDPISDVDGVDGGQPSYWAIQVELGIERCIPTVSDVEGDQGGKPTGAQWLKATQESLDDAAALRRAVCCLMDVYGKDGVLMGPINPLQNEGNCGGQSVIVTVRAPACDCIDAG